MYQAVADKPWPLLALYERYSVGGRLVDAVGTRYDEIVADMVRFPSGCGKLIVPHGCIINHPGTRSRVGDDHTADVVVLMPPATTVGPDYFDVES